MRFNNIQILRLFAAVGVVVHHVAAYGEFEFGVAPDAIRWLRLDWFAPCLNPLFFAISGFVLSHVLQNTPPLRFLVNRALRLYPGYWIALALVTGSFALGLWPGRYLTVARPAPTIETVFAVPPSSVKLGQYPLMVEWTLIYEVVLWLWLLTMWAALGKKRMPYVVAVWLAAIAVKCVFWPNFGSQTLPSWRSVWVSVFVAPFMLGILSYYLKDRGRSWRWAVLAAILATHTFTIAFIPMMDIDAHFGLRSIAAGLTVWFLVQIPDAAATNKFVVAGGFSYGLYLLHVPLILFSMRVMEAIGLLAGTMGGVAVAGVFAVAAGLTFGYGELLMYGRVKKLGNLPVSALLKRLTTRLQSIIRLGNTTPTGR